MMRPISLLRTSSTVKAAMVVVVALLLLVSGCTEGFQPGSRYGDCMADAGFQLSGFSTSYDVSSGQRITKAEILDPPPTEQTEEMLAQSDLCVEQVNRNTPRIMAAFWLVGVGIVAVVGFMVRRWWRKRPYVASSGHRDTFRDG